MPQLAGIKQRTPEWFAARKAGPDGTPRISCSVLGAILGLNPYQTAKKQWQEMIGLRSFGGNVATAHGETSEPHGLAAYESAVEDLTDDGGFWVHPSIEWLCGSPDALRGRQTVVEVKCPYNGKIPDIEPPHYRAQCLGLLEVTQRDECHLFYWVGREQSRLFVIERDPAQWADWYPTIERFHRKLKEKCYAV